MIKLALGLALALIALPAWADDADDCSGSDHNLAIQACTRQIQTGTYPGVSYNNRAVAYEGLNQYNQALSDFSHAIELRDYAAYSHRGWVYLKLGQFDAALADANAAIAFYAGFEHPEYENIEFAEAYTLRADAYAEKKNPSQAAEDYRKALSYDVDDEMRGQIRHEMAIHHVAP